MYKCLKSFSLPVCDGDGFTIENEESIIGKDSIWNLPEDNDYRLIGGEVRLESDEFGWIEISKEDLEEYFQAISVMKFYEFSGGDFGYYALIGAESEEKAIKFYEEVVADVEDENSSPDEITKDQAKNRLIGICKNEYQRIEAEQEFNECIHQDDPYLILIDGSLL